MQLETADGELRSKVLLHFLPFPLPLPLLLLLHMVALTPVCSPIGLVQVTFRNPALRMASFVRVPVITRLLGWEWLASSTTTTRYFVSRHSFVPCRTPTHLDQIQLGPPPRGG
ncbi:uncharacterized protein LY79DRAFT_73091 [Colletotrichum navitas]|uniref:Uncharacterized protein n=1 Tax=Colletotrichum navitas TaxID=681940 RepID=A0AAD8Q515_9PEZI|nr:uncharacterized protein LY79DRAFT_73091 [Colletotrichum navitas]KAK1595980.1 hypothetical protein LY79DRAFT_73091 [Colletotrichum navitas]